MKIINALGGGGSSFLFRALDARNYRRQVGAFHPYRMKRRLERYPWLLGPYKKILRRARIYRPQTIVLLRPDSYWTDWSHYPGAGYRPNSPDFGQQVRRQKAYLAQTQNYRSAGLPLVPDKIAVDSLPALVASYVAQLKQLEREREGEIILLAGHWGEYGIFQELNLPVTYLIRDPFNSLISHSKPERHEKDYRRLGYADINSRRWIDAYLSGPFHFWIRHARAALNQANASVVRYGHFQKDWQQLPGMPDISPQFEYRSNPISQVLRPESIDYIRARTAEICRALDLRPPQSIHW